MKRTSVRLAKFTARLARNFRWYLNSLVSSGFSRLNLGVSLEGRVRISKSFAVRCLSLFTGASLLATGIVMTILAGLGVGPADVFITGVAATAGVSMAIASYSYLLVVVIGVFAVRRRPSLGGLTLSAIVSTWFFVLPSTIPLPQSAIGSWVYLLCGLILMVIGVEMAAAAGFGRGNTEIFVEELARRKGTTERLVRTFFESFLLITGLILGGQAGIGTVVVAVSIGPLLQAFALCVNDFQVGRALRLQSASDNKSDVVE